MASIKYNSILKSPNFTQAFSFLQNLSRQSLLDQRFVVAELKASGFKDLANKIDKMSSKKYQALVSAIVFG